MPENPAERSAHARIAALARVAAEPSGEAMTARARRAFAESFYAATDPALPERERLRQAEAARKLHYQRLARLSVKARRAAAAAAELSDQAVSAARQLAS